MKKAAITNGTRAAGCACLVLAAFPVWGQGEFWGELKAGRYGVGFRAVYQLDGARSYDAEYPVPGRATPKKARPVLVAIWYPATPDQGKPMIQRDYLRALTLDDGAPDFSPLLRTFTRDQACHYMIGKDYDELNDDERARWEGLLSTPVYAVLNAPPAEGKFPIVLYHPGLSGTYEDNAVAAEYLASHGYVVVSSAYQSADSSSLDIDGDLETSFADLGVLVRYAATLQFADAGHIGAVGHSYGAQAMIGWRAFPNSPLDAVVFLDSGVLYVGLEAAQFRKTKAAVERNANSSVPVMFVADRERHPHFETFAPYLKFTAHYEVTTPALEHNAFVSQGVVGKDEGARRSYEAVCGAMLRFLDAYLKDDLAALQWLRAPAGREDGPLQLRSVAGAPPPPTGAQIARLYRSEERSNPQTLTAFLKSAEPAAVAAAAAILYEGDEKKQAVELLKAAAKVHSRSALIEESLGESLLGAGDRDGAIAALERALALLPGDETLNETEKTQLRDAIEQARKK
jgi:dienelactone hydrolase